ncbi:hypothetical protein DPEC_G00375530, partial [Dallia pectoralis]
QRRKYKRISCVESAEDEAACSGMKDEASSSTKEAVRGYKRALQSDSDDLTTPYVKPRGKRTQGESANKRKKVKAAKTTRRPTLDSPLSRRNPSEADCEGEELSWFGLSKRVSPSKIKSTSSVSNSKEKTKNKNERRGPGADLTKRPNGTLKNTGCERLSSSKTPEAPQGLQHHIGALVFSSPGCLGPADPRSAAETSEDEEADGDSASNGSLEDRPERAISSDSEEDSDRNDYLVSM